MDSRFQAVDSNFPVLDFEFLVDQWSLDSRFRFFARGTSWIPDSTRKQDQDARRALYVMLLFPH